MVTMAGIMIDTRTIVLDEQWKINVTFYNQALNIKCFTKRQVDIYSSFYQISLSFYVDPKLHKVQYLQIVGWASFSAAKN